MNRGKFSFPPSLELEADEVIEWPTCSTERSDIAHVSSFSGKVTHVQLKYAPDWTASVPAAIAQLSVLQRKTQQLRINLLEIVVNDLKATVHRLQSIQTKIVPINTFAP